MDNTLSFWALLFRAMQAVLELRDLVKRYATHTAVDGVSLAVEQGAFYSLLGPSGCGKTTTLRLVAGFEQPTRGEVLLGGQLVNGRAPYQRNVSTVFQSYALFPHLTVAENVAFGLRERGIKDTRKPVDQALGMVQLRGKEARLPAQLSGGERQRVALARSLVLKPDVLLLDEPLAALDPKLRKAMRAELKEMQRQVGVTFLFVTHDQEEALSMSDRIAVMNAGKVEQVGTAREVYLRPKSRFVAGFLGAINWIGEIGVRPECVRVARNGDGVAARILRQFFLGNIAQVVLGTESGEVLAEVGRGDCFADGEMVKVCWNEADEIRL
jgi:spermidine/putrescine transport system ATP-binding protein